MKKNILITTGGSGGHVIPAMILCDHLSKDSNVTISTDKRGLRYLDKNNYAIVRYETNDDLWTEQLLLEIKDACQMIKVNQKCLSVLFMSNSKNSGFGLSNNFSPITKDYKAIINSALIAVEELPIPSFFLMRGVTHLPAIEIALACDVRFALDDAIISLADKENHLQPSDFIVDRLAKLSHRSFALDLLLLNSKI